MYNTMKLSELLEVMSDGLNIVCVDIEEEVLGVSDGRNSIDEKYNSWRVWGIVPDPNYDFAVILL